MISLPAGRQGSESGSLTVFTALFMVALIAVCGLVIDGGRYLAARQAASSEAEQAARAGAEALDTSALRAGAITVNPSQGIAAAESLMSQSGHPGTATVVGDRVTATVSPYRVHTALLGIVGIGTFIVTASASATSVHGVAAGDH